MDGLPPGIHTPVVNNPQYPHLALPPMESDRKWDNWVPLGSLESPLTMRKAALTQPQGNSHLLQLLQTQKLEKKHVLLLEAIQLQGQGLITWW